MQDRSTWFGRITQRPSISAITIGLFFLAAVPMKTLGCQGGTNEGARVGSGEGAAPYSIFVPVILSSAGLNNSFFTTELTLTNRGSSAATLMLTYTPSFGAGVGAGGTALTVLPAGRQEIIPDAIAHLRELGINIPDTGNPIGTLKVQVTGAASEGDVAVTARTTTVAAEGRVGLAYRGVPNADLLNHDYDTLICGLRQTTAERSNLALQNAGGPTDGPITLRVIVCDGDSGALCYDFPQDIILAPGEFRQISGILDLDPKRYWSFPAGAPRNGYVRFLRINGSAPYYAYGVINDQATSDGSFVPPISSSNRLKNRLTLPVIVESATSSSELIVTELSEYASHTIEFEYTADAIQTSDQTARFSLTVPAGRQLIIPNLVQELRNLGISGIGPPGPVFAGPLRVVNNNPSLSVAARTTTKGGGGKVGVYYPGAQGEESIDSAWLYGLQQNAESRTNLALVNIGNVDGSSSTFNIELYDGATGLQVATVSGISLAAHAWMQIGSVLADYAPGTKQGYARVTRVSGTNSFIAYAVINDGGHPGERSGDGAFIPSAP